MGAKIQVVDYNAIPGIAKRMRENGEKLNHEIITAYNRIADMHEIWYGIRYNELIKSFNNLVNSVNEILALVVETFPFSLETVSNNYSRADKGVNACNAQQTAPEKVVDLKVFNDVGMRFLRAEVSDVKTNVSNNFKNAESYMNAIEGIFKEITWQSEAADAYKSKFAMLKKKIIADFEQIEEDFTKLMKQSEEDIQAAEDANTVQ